MSTPEHDNGVEPQRSSVTIDRDSKGPKVRVKVYDGVDHAEFERIRQLAITAYKQTTLAIGATL